MSNTPGFTDSELVQAIRNGNEQALSFLYRTHYAMVLHFILNNNGTEEEAKDIYQESIILFYEKIKQEHFALSCQIKTFLYSVCRRMWLKRLASKNKKSDNLEDFSEFLTFENEVEENEAQEKKYKQMADALTQLGEPCKTLIEDFYIQQLSMQAIAEKFGYTNPENAKNQKYKCLMRLRKLFFTTFSYA